MASGRGEFVSLVLAVLGVLAGQAGVEARLNAIYVLGDSTMDVGNNNYLKDTKAKADFLYYGVDFPSSTPTGRFSNGLNTADQLAILLGFPLSPPAFLSLTQTNLTKTMLTWGVNFASGGSGLLDETGSLVVEAISMRRQIEYFATVRGNLTTIMGSKGATRFLSNCLFLISAGSNDMFEYSYGLSDAANESILLSNLTSNCGKHLRGLYELGARKFGIVSIPPLGCCPSQRARKGNGECDKDLNILSKSFYQALKPLMKELQKELPQMKYALGNTFDMVKAIYENPMPLGAFAPLVPDYGDRVMINHFYLDQFNRNKWIKELRYACCGSGEFNGYAQCNVTDELCANRSEYVFWDWFHPTQAVTEIAAETLYSAATKFVTPINIKQLAEDDC